MNIYSFSFLLTFVGFLSIASAQEVADEAAALAVLVSSDAAVYNKAMACDVLGRVGTAKAVPALTELLADEKLHDYARDGLERIEDAAAGKALLNALNTLKGSQRLGIIISLGDRREKTAVPRLAEIARDDGKQAVDAALSSLAQIGTPEAAEAILSVLKSGEADTRILAARAALLTAQQQENSGQTKSARKLRKTVAAANVPAYVKAAAGKQ